VSTIEFYINLSDRVQENRGSLNSQFLAFFWNGCAKSKYTELGFILAKQISMDILWNPNLAQCDRFVLTDILFNRSFQSHRKSNIV